jgi:hypothetical protein
MPKKREWSRTFTPRSDKVVNLNISGIPKTLRARFGSKCRGQGKSQRNLLLSWIRNWVEGRRPDEDGKGRMPSHIEQPVQTPVVMPSDLS